MLASGKKGLMYQKIGCKYHLFLLLNFLCAAILNFYDVVRLPILLHTKESCFLWSKYSARSAHCLGMIFIVRGRIALLESKFHFQVED